MKKLFLMITAMAFLFVACEKDQAIVQTDQQETSIEFKIDQSNFDLKNTVPMCDDDAIWSHVVFTIEDADGITSSYTSTINYIGDEFLTQVIKLDPGVYLLTSFMVYDTDGNIIRAAPMSGSIYHDLMMYQLDLEFTVEAFFKKQIAIDVLCYEELAYDDFGFTWFEFNDVRIERQCIFGDICIDDYQAYIGSLYDLPGQGIQFDMPAIIKVKIFKEDAVDPIRVFSNEDTYGDGTCLEIYWPNRIADEGEEFNVELYVWLPGANGFEYVLMDTWNFVDGNGATTGTDGVVDFVIGGCNLDPADYEYTLDEEYVPLHDPILEIQFDELMHYHNMHITSDGMYYYTIDGGNSNGHINKYDLNLNLLATFNINIDGRGLSYNKADGYLYASLFTGDVVKITDLTTGSWTMIHSNKLQNSQASFALSEDGVKFYDFYNGTLKVWDLATGSLLETINGLSNGSGNFGGNACVAVDPDYIYTWNTGLMTVYAYDHAGVLQTSFVLPNGNNGHSLSFVDGILFANDDSYSNGTGTWYGYNIRNAVSKNAIIINSTLPAENTEAFGTKSSTAIQ